VQRIDQSASEAVERERGRLFAIAYGMLGITAEAEDVVQEAFARWHEGDRSAVRSPAAFLTTVVTRLAIDRLRSAEPARRVCRALAARAAGVGA
jgi:RNA polymerase sigma-70 factor, ECF subfamily